MPGTLELRTTRCAICGTERNATELYPANFESEALNPAVFSARRLPDRIHYRVVKCNACGLVRSDPIADPALLEQLYHQSTFTYDDEVADLKRTYGHYLARLDAFGAQKGALLEIGCGNGFFLQQALAQGYRTVRGVEPSRAAVDQAAPEVRDAIVCGLMRAGLFSRAQFDVICLFQVFDHVPDPADLLEACLAALRPGGLVLAINHNVEAVSARLLGKRSPIIDIEHTYLYTPATMARIFKAHGFEIRRVGSVRNRYSLRYLVRLLPLPAAPKRAAVTWLQECSFGRLRLWVPLGNLFLVAQKPAHSSETTFK
jgi:2-polyprenyl-3-methyl-5-hydroxy-6-metoxy-1,4-benzoquinol methylase